MSAPVWIEIAQTLGPELARAIESAMPGQSRRVPLEPTPWWEARLGNDHARAACQLLGGTILSVPSSAARAASVADAYRSGMTINDIASAHYISERTVRRMLKTPTKTPQDYGQGSLL